MEENEEKEINTNLTLISQKPLLKPVATKQKISRRSWSRILACPFFSRHEDALPDGDIVEIPITPPPALGLSTILLTFQNQPQVLCLYEHRP